MSKFTQKTHRHVGELSSKYAYDKDGKQFENDIRQRMEDGEKLYNDFIEWMKEKKVDPLKFRDLFMRYYEDFIK